MHEVVDNAPLHFLLTMEDFIMTRWIGTVLIAIGAVSVTLASANQSEAWGRRGGGSCGSHGGWGNGGSRGGGGSFGGLFSRWRNGGSNGGGGSHGGWHDNGCGSHGGRHYSNGCGSHGGTYHGESGEVRAADSGVEGEVRYYGERVESATPMAAPAPIMDNEEQGRDADANRDSIEAPNPPDQDSNQPRNINEPIRSDQPGATQPGTAPDNVNPPAPPADPTEGNPVNNQLQGAGAAEGSST
jgi:hypothetical protein